ncbi:3-hydroxyacyl-CoA dehydrogenase NAD-binding domain-containing protein [Paraliomyxa miuraensis]|uniref:3-hydroxyacyl-CoA dehydrogenase NAD-binding domain-containing protein n=1 Tax=Paraliomyxa miuraensis TaxID=376150 RepID=UPI002252D6AF|nr:3-hydroxyacyl-CoA dehydrogenase NAD-binding domain-containing protein [Paraliomyxa miuraensis]MCX4243094.1 3-hydroxyacyl-CoA dehydrogenase NAD-binding domain-containing protein [Paraliomyxa miuraensis]
MSTDTAATTDNGQALLALDPSTGVATVTLQMTGRANKINDDFGHTLLQAIDWVQAQEAVKGLVLASGHKDFCVGADIDRLYRERDPADLMRRLRELHGLFRRIEQLPFPVVAALTGSALGGGFELALACHHRIAVDDPRIQLGLPEVSLGVIPGAGGTQRLPRLIGIQPALEHIAQGKILRAPQAKKVGFVDALAPDRSALLAAAQAWIAEHPKARQPWDDKKFRFPGPRPGSDDARNLFMAGSAMLYKKTAGAFPAAEAVMSVVQEGCAVTFDAALVIEMRAFAKLATSDQAKDMIRTLWYHRTAAEKHEGLPSAAEHGLAKVAILGAGMMGAGLGFVCAKAGLQVVLKDVKQEALDRGLAHVDQQVAAQRHLSADDKHTLRGRLTGTLEAAELEGCDLIIEAVFESLALKHAVTREAEPMLAESGIWASNTSAIPITDLAKASAHPDRFIGMHFFSPVEKMQLLEIITPEATSEQTLARSLAFCRAIKKLPIVVGDGYGFYTTRVFSAYILEGAQLVAEGHDPATIEWAARAAGMVVPPLQVFDEVTLTLAAKGFEQGRAYGKTLDIPGVALVERMVELGRHGKAAGQGFYDYAKDGRRLWKGLSELVTARPEATGVDLVGRRLLGLQALEAARCVADGVIKKHRDAEVGAIFGIGFAPNTGGPLSYIDRRGVSAFVEEMDGFAKAYGARYEAPPLLRDMARKGERFFEAV